MPGLREFYEQLLEQGSVNGIQSPWEKNNTRESALQTGVGAAKPFIVRGTQRKGNPNPQYWGGVAEAAAVDAARLTKIMVSLEGIKFTNRQLLLNRLSVRPEKNFSGAILSGPISAFTGVGIPRSSRVRLSLDDLDPLNLQFGVNVEPTFRYTRDESEGNILRIFNNIRTPEEAFKTQKIKSSLNAGNFQKPVNTYSTTQNNQKVDPSKLSNPRVSINGFVNQYDEDHPYTGSSSPVVPQDKGYQDLVKFSDSAVSQSFVDFRDITSEPPRVMDNRVGDYTYKDHNLYARYGFARAKSSPAGRDFTEFGQLSELDAFYYEQSGQTPTKAPEVPDLVDVHFRILGTDTVLYFRSAVELTGDSLNFNWNQENYVGRIDPVHYFSGVAPRQVRLTLKMMPHSKLELEFIWRKVNLLYQMAAPSITSNSQIRGTFLELTVGDYFKNRRGFITDIVTDHSQDMYWEINTERSSLDYQLPRFLEVQVGYTISDNHPSDNRKFYFGESGTGGIDQPSIHWFDGDAIGVNS